MGKKQKIFGCSLENLVKRAEQELKKVNSTNLDGSSKSLKKKPITSRYVVKHIPPEIQEFIQFFTIHEVWNVEGIFRKNSSVKDLTKAKKIIEEEGTLNLDRYEEKDVILVSGLFKNFLAEMQGRVIPYRLYTKLKETKTDAEIKETLKELPLINYETLNYINQFVLIVNDHCETNYMNLANLSIVIGPNLFELTNDEMVNLDITVKSSEIYKNILRIRKSERDNAEGINPEQANLEKVDNDSMIIKNLDSSLNVISELPQSYTSINEVINNAANNRNLTRRNSIIKTIFIDNIKDKIQRRRSSISIPMIRNEKRKSDLHDDEDERLKSDEYHGYEIFSIDDTHSTRAESFSKDSNYEILNENYDESIKHHFVENSDDSYNESIHNQDSNFSPDNNNMETINEESYDSLVASRHAINKNNSEKCASKSKLNESTNNMDDEESQLCSDSESLSSDNNESFSSDISESSNESDDESKKSQDNQVREQKIFQHKPLFDEPEISFDSDENKSQMSRISSLDDVDKINYNENQKENKKTIGSQYYDTMENDDYSDNDNNEDETIEIINNESISRSEIFYSTNKILTDDDDDINKNSNDNKEKTTTTDNDNKYLTKDEIISKVSKPKKFESKRKKFNTVGPRSNIKFMINSDDELNLKDAMSTTNLNGENDPSEFLNKKLISKDGTDISRKSLSKNFSRMIKNNKNNVFESNMAFVNKNFDENGSMFMKDDNDNYQSSNSNYSMFYNKMKNDKGSIEADSKEIFNQNQNQNEDNEEYFDSNENIETNNEMTERVFVPLKGNDNDENVNENINDNDVSKNDIGKSIEIDEYQKDKMINQHSKEESDSVPVDENAKETKSNLEGKSSNSGGNKKKLSRKNSRRTPKCISKSSAAALSMLQFNFENVDVDKVNDNDLDEIFNKTLKHDDSNLSEHNNLENNPKNKLLDLKTEFFSCEDEDGTNFNAEQKLEAIKESSQSNLSLNKNNSSSQQNIPKSPAKPAPPPPSYNKVKTKTSSPVDASITDIYENVEGNTIENEIHTKMISDEIRERLQTKRKKDHRPDDINKMTYKEILKEKKAIKQELVLLKSMYSHHHANNSTSIYNNNNNDFIRNSLKDVVGSNLEADSKLNGKPPLNYDSNSGVISKKLQKEDIKYMKELYQKYAEIKFIIAKQNLEMENDNENSSIGLEKLKQEKLALQIKLKNYQEEFIEKNGRPIKTLEDQKPIRQDYLRYKELKKILQQSS